MWDHEIRLLQCKQAHELKLEQARDERLFKRQIAAQEHESRTIRSKVDADKEEAARDRVLDVLKPFLGPLITDTMKGRTVGHYRQIN